MAKKVIVSSLLLKSQLKKCIVFLNISFKKGASK
jgi:hypothetical protein